MPLIFERVFSLDAGLVVEDRLAAEVPLRLDDLSIAPDIAVRYTAIGEVFHESRLDAWQSLRDKLDGFHRDGELRLRREFK